MGKEEKKEKKASKKHSSKEDKPFFPSSSSSSATIKKSKRTLEENQKLTSDSYFIKMDHFRVWLKQYKLKSFEDLTTEKAMKYFSKFIIAYNEGSLEDFYYMETLPLDIKASSTRTAHNWNLKVNDNDLNKLEDVQHEINSRTNSLKQGAWIHQSKTSAPPSKASPAYVSSSSASAAATILSIEAHREKVEALQHYQRSKSREAREEVLEEFAPDDRERKKKKAGYGQYIAAGHRDEGDMEGLRGNIDLMGGGDDDKRRQIEIAQRRQLALNKKEKRIRELAAQERQRNQACMELLGVDLSKGPIKIRPREE